MQNSAMSRDDIRLVAIRVLLDSQFPKEDVTFVTSETKELMRKIPKDDFLKITKEILATLFPKSRRTSNGNQLAVIRRLPKDIPQDVQDRIVEVVTRTIPKNGSFVQVLTETIASRQALGLEEKLKGSHSVFSAFPQDPAVLIMRNNYGTPQQTTRYGRLGQQGKFVPFEDEELFAFKKKWDIE